MTANCDFLHSLEAKVLEQLRSQRVGYLLGAGSSYLGGAGYPLACELWESIKERIPDSRSRMKIQAKLNEGAAGLEQALDLLDDGGVMDTPYRQSVIVGIADLFQSKTCDLDAHIQFVTRLAQRPYSFVKIFSLNYDPLIERAAESAQVRLVDGFVGVEHAFFCPAVFDEYIGRVERTFRRPILRQTAKPIRLFKLHGSLGWYEGPHQQVRRCAFTMAPPNGARRLMVPPQHRKANDTVRDPYATLWSAFRGCLCHNADPLNRLACFGYGFADEHVNAVIAGALERPDFTLLIFAKSLCDTAWTRWSSKSNAVVVTQARCSLKGKVGPGHADLWQFERLCREV